jgi:DNA-binding transcriptional MocR family regulator
MMTETLGDAPHRYEELAGFVAELVEKGILRPGSRAPSLRRLSKDRHASLSTALKAYQLLEDRGILERGRARAITSRAGPPRRSTHRRCRGRRERRPASAFPPPC